MLLLLAHRVIQIKAVDAELIRHNDVDVVGNALCDPVMASDCLEPPDFIDIGKCDAVHFIGSVLLEQAAEPLDALAGRVNVRKCDRHEVLLADSSDRLRLIALRSLVLHERISAEHARI